MQTNVMRTLCFSTRNYPGTPYVHDWTLTVKLCQVSDYCTCAFDAAVLGWQEVIKAVLAVLVVRAMLSCHVVRFALRRRRLARDVNKPKPFKIRNPQRVPML